MVAALNTQKSLFPPIARFTDPDTSKLAERRHNLTARSIRQRQTLELVYLRPARTASELGSIMVNKFPMLPTAVALLTPAKRLSDLYQNGLVERFGKRKCSVTGYQAHIWECTDKGIKELNIR